jgi:hypothetical protein
MKSKAQFKRFNLIQISLIVLFAFSLFLDLINKEFLNSFLPKEIVGYQFWFLFGMIIGFSWCKYEYIIMIKKYNEANGKAPK